MLWLKGVWLCTSCKNESVGFLLHIVSFFVLQLASESILSGRMVGKLLFILPTILPGGKESHKEEMKKNTVRWLYLKLPQRGFAEPRLLDSAGAVLGYPPSRKHPL